MSWPLQARLRALAESVSRRAQQRQQEAAAAGAVHGAEMSPETPMSAMSHDGSGRRSAGEPPLPPPLQPLPPPLHHAQQQQQPKLPDVFQWGGN